MNDINTVSPSSKPQHRMVLTTGITPTITKVVDTSFDLEKPDFAQVPVGFSISLKILV